MPYADPEKRRAASRESQRRRRAGQPGRQPLPELAELRVETACDVLDLLNGQVAELLADDELGTIERARAIGYLSGLLLRTVEAADTVERLEALEAVLKVRAA